MRAPPPMGDHGITLKISNRFSATSKCMLLQNKKKKITCESALQLSYQPLHLVQPAIQRQFTLFKHSFKETQLGLKSRKYMKRYHCARHHKNPIEIMCLQMMS